MGEQITGEWEAGERNRRGGGAFSGPTICYWKPTILFLDTVKLIAGQAGRVRILGVVHLYFLVG